MAASVKDIVKKISYHFLRLVLISILIAIPLAWYAMQTWIEGHAYRIDINPLTFIGVGFLVSFRAIRAGLKQSKKKIRTE